MGVSVRLQTPASVQLRKRFLMIHAVKTEIDPVPSLLPSLHRIAEIASLKPNWDGEDADPPTSAAVAAACLLIEAVAEHRERLGRHLVPPLTSSPIADGGLQIEWRGPRSRIDVQANPDGSYGYLVKSGQGNSSRYEEADNISLETILSLIDRVLGE